MGAIRIQAETIDAVEFFEDDNGFEYAQITPKGEVFVVREKEELASLRRLAWSLRRDRMKANRRSGQKTRRNRCKCSKHGRVIHPRKQAA